MHIDIPLFSDWWQHNNLALALIFSVQIIQIYAFLIYIMIFLVLDQTEWR